MSEVKRKYVIPGELIVEGKYRPDANVIQKDDKFYSTRIGMAEFGYESIRVIPLSGPYIPRIDDLVIGKVINSSAFGWDVDISSIFPAYLPAASVYGRDYNPGQESLSDMLRIGDLIVVQIAAFDRTRDPLISINGQGLGKIPNGDIVKISTTKVPRLIGKKGAMIKTIEAGTGCRLTIGQNGVIVIVGPRDGINRSLGAIKLVEEDAHMADLTQKVQNLLSSNNDGEELNSKNNGEENGKSTK